jgi:hypothetical protein
VATVHEASMFNQRSHEAEPGSADWRGRRGRGGAVIVAARAEGRRVMGRMRAVRGWLLARIVGKC